MEIGQRNPSKVYHEVVDRPSERQAQRRSSR